MTAPLLERLESIEAQTDSLLKLFRDADWQEDCTLIMGLMNIRGGIREALAELAEREKDAERLNHLELEYERERSTEPYGKYVPLFRRNLPITRAAIDAAIKEEK